MSVSGKLIFSQWTWPWSGGSMSLHIANRHLNGCERSSKARETISFLDSPRSHCFCSVTQIWQEAYEERICLKTHCSWLCNQNVKKRVFRKLRCQDISRRTENLLWTRVAYFWCVKGSAPGDNWEIRPHKTTSVYKVLATSCIVLPPYIRFCIGR